MLISPSFSLRFHYLAINPVLKLFIIEEMLLWSAWNFINPIFAIFVTKLPKGDIETAASAVSVYLIIRVVFELVSGKYLTKSSDIKKIWITIIGMTVMSFAYLGFAITTNVLQVFIFYGLLGLGFGIASPAKNSLFSDHLDHNKRTLEWGIVDASALLSMAFAAILGGFIAKNYGFPALFIAAALVNFLGMIPYFLYLKNRITLFK